MLAHLPLDELVACRQVCRRLRAACLHRCLWRGARVREPAVLRAALALAPCLAEVSALVPIEDLAAALAPGTACVVSKLGLDVEGQRHVGLATDVVLKLAAVGGVKQLCLYFGRHAPTHALAPLLEAVYGLDGLRELELVNIEGCEPLPWRGSGARRPSLTKLVYYSESATEPFLLVLMRTHATTLEEVELYFHDPAVTLLPRIPRCYWSMQARFQSKID